MTATSGVPDPTDPPTEPLDLLTAATMIEAAAPLIHALVTNINAHNWDVDQGRVWLARYKRISTLHRGPKP
jgi:hypothetical protein